MILPIGGLVTIIVGIAFAVAWRLEVGLITIGGGIAMWAVWLVVFYPAWRELEEGKRE